MSKEKLRNLKNYCSRKAKYKGQKGVWLKTFAQHKMSMLFDLTPPLVLHVQMHSINFRGSESRMSKGELAIWKKKTKRTLPLYYHNFTINMSHLNAFA